MGGENTSTDSPVLRFDLGSQAFKQDPFPTLARMRQLGPLIRARKKDLVVRARSGYLAGQSNPTSL